MPSSSSTCLTGAPLFNDAELHGRRHADDATTAQIWMRCDTGQFADKRVRQALALTHRPAGAHRAAVQGQGRARPTTTSSGTFYPYFSDTVTQRAQDIAKAKQLLADAGVPDLKATLQYGKLQEIPDLAVLIQSQAAQAGITITPAGEDNGPVLRRPVVPDRTQPIRRAPAPPSSASSTTATAPARTSS